MKKNFIDATVLVQNRENGIQPAMFIFENGRVYMVTITPDHKFEITDEGLIGDRYNEKGEWCQNNTDEKGWTITYLPWDDMECKERVAGRFKTTKEKDEFLEKIYKPDSGWMEEELATISIHNDYNYILPV